MSNETCIKVSDELTNGLIKIGKVNLLKYKDEQKFDSKLKEIFLNMITKESKKKYDNICNKYYELCDQIYDTGWSWSYDNRLYKEFKNEPNTYSIIDYNDETGYYIDFDSKLFTPETLNIATDFFKKNKLLLDQIHEYTIEKQNFWKGNYQLKNDTDYEFANEIIKQLGYKKEEKEKTI